MPDPDAPIVSRDFSRTDGKRGIVAAAIFFVVAASYWFMLPVIQWVIVPHTQSGPDGPWVVRPILAFHLGAVAVMTCVTVPLLGRSLKRKWKQEDAVMGSQY